MYQAFRIASLHERTGKDVLYLDFMEDAPIGHACVAHPGRQGQHTLELKILGEPFEVSEADAELHFTDDQLRLYHRREDEELRLAPTAPEPNFKLGPLRDFWGSTRLTFFRDRIQQLEPDDMFAVLVRDEGTYVLKRHQFEDVFRNVVESRSYAIYGSYNYSRTPQKAHPFLIS